MTQLDSEGRDLGRQQQEGLSVQDPSSLTWVGFPLQTQSVPHRRTGQPPDMYRPQLQGDQTGMHSVHNEGLRICLNFILVGVTWNLGGVVFLRQSFIM